MWFLGYAFRAKSPLQIANSTTTANLHLSPNGNRRQLAAEMSHRPVPVCRCHCQHCQCHCPSSMTNVSVRFTVMAAGCCNLGYCLHCNRTCRPAALPLPPPLTPSVCFLFGSPPARSWSVRLSTVQSVCRFARPPSNPAPQHA